MRYRSKLDELRYTRPVSARHLSSNGHQKYENREFPLIPYLELGFAVGLGYLALKENLLWSIPATIFALLGINGLARDKEYAGRQAYKI